MSHCCRIRTLVRKVSIKGWFIPLDLLVSIMFQTLPAEFKPMVEDIQLRLPKELTEKDVEQIELQLERFEYLSKQNEAERKSNTEQKPQQPNPRSRPRSRRRPRKKKPIDNPNGGGQQSSRRRDPKAEESFCTYCDCSGHTINICRLRKKHLANGNTTFNLNKSYPLSCGVAILN